MSWAGGIRYRFYRVLFYRGMKLILVYFPGFEKIKQTYAVENLFLCLCNPPPLHQLFNA
jgi:hypothetical protein